MIQSYMIYVGLLSGLLAIGFVTYFTLFHKAQKTKTKKDDIAIKVLLGIPFVLLDYYTNIVLSIVFLEAPRSPTELVTHRMTRYSKMTPNGFLDKFRHFVGYNICRFLNKEDPGHCS